MTAGFVPNGSLSPLYDNTTPGTTAGSAVLDAAVIATVQTINDNWQAFYDFLTGPIIGVPDQSITSAKIRDLAITTLKLAELAVTTSKIADLNVTTAKIAELAVTAAKIANATITEPKMANLSVSRRTIIPGSVGANEIDPTILNPISDATINVRLNQIDEQLMDIAISPDNFSGTDLEKVQAAFDAALTLNQSVLLGRLYDITGGTITLNKSILTRMPLYITAANRGGIYKTDAGFMFTGVVANIADIFFDGVLFRGNPSVAVKVFDCSVLIGINTSNCFYKDVTTIHYTDDTKYLQSIRMMGDKLIGIKGAALDFAGAHDLVCSNVMIEASTGYFINHRGLGVNDKLYNVRIRDCVIEGLVGTDPAMKLKSAESLLIDGCYFEGNAGGHIVFDVNATLYNAHISNCRHGGTADVLRLIIWPKTCYGCYTNNITANNIGIHDATSVITGRIFSIYDRIITSGTDAPNGLIDYVKDPTNAHTTITGGHKTIWGSMTRLNTSLVSESFTTGQTKKLTFAFPENIYSDDMISVQVFTAQADKHFTVDYFYRDSTTKTNVHVFLTNKEPDTQILTLIRVNVLKTMPTATG